MKLAILAWAALCLLPGLASAGTATDELKRCLARFDGIAWKLPYQPPLKVHACSTPDALYNGAKAQQGQRVLELIGELTLGPDPSTQSEGDDYAAIQSANFTHFDSLFRRHGYSRTALEYGDARVRRDPNTLRMLAGLPTVPESDEEAKTRIASEPPIPFVKLVRYVRRDASGGSLTLTYKSHAKNTWLITIDGMAAP